MICPTCGYMMEAFDKECPRCAKLAEARAQAPTPPTPPDMQPPWAQHQPPLQPTPTVSQPPVTPNWAAPDDPPNYNWVWPFAIMGAIFLSFVSSIRPCTGSAMCRCGARSARLATASHPDHESSLL